jgi:hypothetical protein
MDSKPRKQDKILHFLFFLFNNCLIIINHYNALQAIRGKVGKGRVGLWGRGGEG